MLSKSKLYKKKSTDGRFFLLKKSLVGVLYMKDRKEVKFSENGALNAIMESAFESNQLSKVVIPSSVTSIGYGTFNDNLITEFIIKNLEGNITIDENAFPSTATITYNPN